MNILFENEGITSNHFQWIPGEKVMTNLDNDVSDGPGFRKMDESKITVAYVLTSNGKDVYADMTLLSLWSVRHHNPNTKISIISDSFTICDLAALKHPILQEASEIVSVEVGSDSSNIRNRRIKTNLRQYIDGPILYLDGDTLIRGNLSELFSTTALVAGVPNHNGTGSQSEIPGTEVSVFGQMKWPLPYRDYLNGGVLYLADHSDVYKFCDLWHQNWLNCVATTGKHFDQPSLNRALHESGVQFSTIKHCFNAQVHARPHTAWGAVIWHIYLSDHHVSPRNVLEFALERYRNGDTNLRKELVRLCHLQHPWIVQNPIDLFAINTLKHDREILNGDRWERMWLAGEYRLAFIQILRKLDSRYHRLMSTLRK